MVIEEEKTTCPFLPCMRKRWLKDLQRTPETSAVFFIFDNIALLYKDATYKGLKGLTSYKDAIKKYYLEQI
jgi:hypothetical protein